MFDLAYLPRLDMLVFLGIQTPQSQEGSNLSGEPSPRGFLALPKSTYISFLNAPIAKWTLLLLAQETKSH